MINATMRMVPRMPPPIYILTLDLLNRAIRHLLCLRLGALPYGCGDSARLSLEEHRAWGVKRGRHGCKRCGQERWPKRKTAP
jgi:hypothetical protein